MQRDLDAYAHLYERYRAPALRVARALAGPVGADDLVAEAFTRVLKERVYFAWVLAYCILWPLYGRRFFQAIGYEGPVFISANLRRMADRQFVWTGERWFTGHLDSVPRFDDEAEASSETTTKDMEENLARIVVGLFHPLAHACGLDDLLAVSPTDLLQKAYEYLMWDHATVLANKTEP